MPPAPAPPPPPPLEEEPPAPGGPAPPAWRTVVKRPEPGQRRKGKAAATPAPAPPPPLPAAIEAPRPELPSWAQWRREYAFCFWHFVVVVADDGIAPASQPILISFLPCVARRPHRRSYKRHPLVKVSLVRVLLISLTSLRS